MRTIVFLAILMLVGVAAIVVGFREPFSTLERQSGRTVVNQKQPTHYTDPCFSFAFDYPSHWAQYPPLGHCDRRRAYDVTFSADSAGSFIVVIGPSVRDYPPELNLAAWVQEDVSEGQAGHTITRQEPAMVGGIAGLRTEVDSPEGYAVVRYDVQQGAVIYTLDAAPSSSTEIDSFEQMVKTFTFQ